MNGALGERDRDDRASVKSIVTSWLLIIGTLCVWCRDKDSDRGKRQTIIPSWHGCQSSATLHNCYPVKQVHATDVMPQVFNHPQMRPEPRYALLP